MKKFIDLFFETLFFIILYYYLIVKSRLLNLLLFIIIYVHANLRMRNFGLSLHNALEITLSTEQEIVCLFNLDILLLVYLIFIFLFEQRIAYQ